MRSDRSVPRRPLRSLSIRLARAGSAAALALMAATCHSDKVTNVCTVSQLVFTTQPTSVGAGALMTVSVAAQNAGSTQTCFTGDITLALAGGPAGAVLNGNAPASAVGGVATFTGLNITKAGSGFTLVASGGGVSGVASSSFSISPGPAVALAFTTQPATTTAGASFTTIVTAQDQYGNPATSFSGGTNTVTVAIGTNGGSPTPGALSGTKIQPAANGVATFPGLSIDKVGTNYTLTAAATSLTGATSAAFNINPGAAAALFFTAQPSNATSGVAMTPPVVVTARDAQGNTATGLAGNVTLTITAGTGTAGAALTGGTVAVANGIATFPALKIDKSGASYTLTATATNVPTVTSAAFNIAPAAASQLAFTIEPSGDTAGGSITPAVVVTALDAAGNTDTAFTGNVTVAIAANPGTGTLSGGAPIPAVAGVATFSNLSINKSGNGYTLAASAAGLSPDTSVAFNITAGTATQLVFTSQPTTARSMVAVNPAVVVTARDALGNTATGLAGNITLTITGGTGTLGATLFGGTAPVAAGVGTFPSVKIDKSGANYTLTATATGVPAAISGTFNITPAAATRLAFTVEPPSDTAGGVFAPAVTVTALDSVGNTDTAFTNTVTMDFAVNAGGGSLKGTLNRTAAAGVATFNDLSIDKSGTGYRLHATSGSLTAATSAPFDITAATATQLAFTVQPANGAAGLAFVPAVEVSAQDVNGNTNPNSSGNVTITITPGTGAPGAHLSGGTSVTAAMSSGVATFSGADSLSIDLVGQDYTLTAAASGLATTASAAFNITPNVASQLVFTVQPANATAGLAIPGAGGNIQVTALDGQGNVATAFTGGVTIAIHPGTGTTGAAFRASSTTTVTANAGVATFANLRIDKSGAGYALDAAAAGTTGATSGTFDVAPGSATQLAFTVQPPATSTAAGVALSPAIQVTALDSLGNRDTAFTNGITVALTGGSGTPNAHLLGGAPATTVAATAGVASFSSLRIDSAGVGYTLSASAGSLVGGPSSSFTIKPGNATQLAFTAQPTAATAGLKIAPPVQVTARDSLGNTDTTFKTGITLAITGGTGTTGAHLTGGASVTATAAAGIATFSGADSLAIDSAGAGYTLSATATGALGPIVGGPSAQFDITPGGATHLVFAVGPSNTAAGDTIKPPVRVAALDALGNIDTNFISPVTMEIGTNPAAGSLGGTTLRTAVKGVATFDDLRIDKAANSYQLLAHAGALTSPLSAPFNIASAAAKQIAFTVQPGTTTAGIAINPAVVVTAQDSLGNIATGFSGEVKVAISSGTTGAHLRGIVGDTVRVTANQGVASFPALRIDSAGIGYILSASTTGLTAVLSTSFSILPGNATTLVFVDQPSNGTAGAAIAPPVTVTARDSLGNRDTTFKTGITVALTGGTGTTGAHLSHGPSVTATAAAGIATFSTLSVDSAGNGYTLSASATGVSGTITGGPSASFDIASAPAVNLVITGQPVTALAGSVIPVTVTARDSLGNTATSFTGIADQVTLAILNNGGNPVAGTLTGGLATPVNGVASFSISIDKVGTGYTVHTTAPFTSAASVPFDITPGAASQLAFTVSPPLQTPVGAQISPAVKVTAQDAQGNTVPTFVNNVTVSIGSGTGNLSGQFTRAALGGVATFSNLSIDTPGSFTLVAKSGGLTDGTSATFDIVASVADHLFFSVQPSSGTAGQALASISVAARDPSNQTVASYTTDVSIEIQSGTGAPGANLTGTTTATTVNLHLVNGVATFDDLKIDKAASSYKLLATSGGLASATSGAFTINPGPADHLGFTLQPSTATTGATITPQVEVTAFDNQGNVATGFTGSVSLAITGTGGGALGGTTPKNAVGGTATFNDLTVSLPGNYQLDATSAGVTSATSNAFPITASQAIHLAFTVQPSAATAGVAISPAIKVTALDSNNVTVTSFSNDVALTITAGTGTSGATLSGTTTATTLNAHLSNGVATFDDVRINKSGSGYKLSASASGVAGATSVSFAITAAPAKRLDFTQQPASTTAGAPITTQVTVKDSLGNPVKNFAGTISVSLLPNVSGGALFNATPVSVDASTGVGTFTNLQVDKSGSGYRLQATSSIGGVDQDTSSAFSITGGAPKQLLFSVQPSNAKANANINPDVRVTALDSLGNVATNFNDVVTLQITGGTGTAGANLSGGSVSASNGVAIFSTVAIDRVGTGYTLTAATATLGVSGATSVGFNITADRLVFTVQPADPQTHGVAIAPAVKVAAQDGLGNTDTTFTGDVTMSKQSGTGGGSLTGTTIVTAVKGVATFDNLIIGAAGTGWSLKASYTPANLTPAISNTFTVN